LPKKKELTNIEQKYKKTAVRLTFLCGCLIFFNFILISLIFTWSDWVALLIFSLLFIVPAYLSNAGMVFTGGGKPIDGGKILKDGRRLFGDHKTWNGLIKGPLYIGIPITIGIFVLLLSLWQFIGPAFNLAIDAGLYKLYDNLTYYEYYFIGGPFPIGFLGLIIRIVVVSYGAAIGDLLGSCLKRRFDIESGAPFWIVDQLDFLLVSIGFIILLGLIAPELIWLPDINIIIFLMILTPSISIIGNNVAYYAGKKSVPW